MAEIFAKAITLVPLKDIKLNPKNRNKHPSDQIDRLVKIIKETGFRRPGTISNRTGFLVCGEGRYLAAKKLGLKEMPVMHQDYADAAQELADAVADNAIDKWAELDTSGIMQDLKEFEEFDLDLLGIKDFRIVEPTIEPQCDEDELPDKVEPRSKLGDIYQLGQHRLMCGDSTSIDAVDKLMNGEKVEITFTSPPYNLGKNAKLRGYNGDGDDSAYREKSDHKTQDEYLQFLKDFTAICVSYSKNSFINIQLLAGNKMIMSEYWNHFKNHLVDLMIWDKEHAQPSAAQRVLNSVFEMIFIFSHEEFPSRSIKTGKEFRGTVQNIFRLNPMRGGKDEFQKDHGAVFPVAFAEHFISNFSNESVLDLFGGSGTTLIACEKTNRKCFMMELDPHYCDVIVARWEKYTGQKATRQPSE